MVKQSTADNPFPEAVMDELLTHFLQVRTVTCANLLWTELTDGERETLGGDLTKAFEQGGTVGIWMRLRPVSEARAIIELANRLGFISEHRLKKLLRDTNEIPRDIDEAIEQAVASNGLVLIESNRSIFWAGEELPIDWHKHSAAWNFVFTLAEQAKIGRGVDHFSFARGCKASYVTKMTSRLSHMAGFPKGLAELIVPAGLNTKRLNLPPDHIHLFRLETVEILKEEIPAAPKTLAPPLTSE
jgi:hypothetical protein